MKNKNDFRSFFPIFKKHPELVYFDTATTSLKPRSMIKALTNFYNDNGLSVRNFGPLCVENLEDIQRIKQKTALFLKADLEEIIFTKSATESLNIISQVLSSLIEPGDEIITSVLEHNSSLFPWMKIANKKKAHLVFVPLDEENKIQMHNLKKVVTEKTKIIVLNHISNVLGYENPVKEITFLAHQKNILVVLDAAQSVGHIPLDVKNLDIDFMAFSTHKIYGPFGLGVLFGKKKYLNQFEPPFVGGGSVEDVKKNKFILHNSSLKWEAGTPNVSGIIAWEKSLDFINKIGLKTIHEHEKNITQKIAQQLKTIKQIKIINPGANNIINFKFENLHSHDVENFLIQDNIYVRTGKHCANLALDQIKEKSTVRISVGIHNNENDIQILMKSLLKLQNFFYS
ncbi:aminotransferase class V-fold PLP-dependent enzyme ['Camptotheca acuminata' phytoplasma]|uniref:aminotransferase class V-fold PLP-dependent enzyme n=1 Tax='Camptotheca acuminata' phytoplasma TaxID=3239192 RepID=UPI00351A8553